MRFKGRAGQGRADWALVILSNIKVVGLPSLPAAAPSLAVATLAIRAFLSGQANNRL